MAENSINITGSSVQGNFVQGDNSGSISYSSASTSNQEESKAIAAEIQSILDGLSIKNPGKEVTLQMQIATATIQALQHDKSLKQKIVSALKSGGTAAIGQFLNHPAASFVIAALEDWNS
jgi:hypothetical protein